MKTKQISIMGGSIWGNRGAEAMLLTTIGELRKVDQTLSFNIFSIYPKIDRALANEPDLRILNGKPLQLALIHLPLALIAGFFRLFRIKFPLPRSLTYLRDSEALLDIGGITFSDGRTFQLLFNVLTIWPAMLLGVPVIKLSQALGPFNMTLNKKLATIFLNKSEHVFSRGYLSAKFLKTLPLEENKIKNAADIAFLYQSAYSISQENESLVSAITKRLKEIKSCGSEVIAVIPSSLVLKQSGKLGINYPSKLLNMVLSTKELNVHYVFLPNSTRASTNKTMNNDIVAIRAIRDYFHQELSPEAFEKIDWVDFDINTKGIRSIIKETDGCVSSRFHAMVASLALGIPTMVIGWSHKYQETLFDFGMQDYAVDYKSTELKILRVYKVFLANNEQIKKELMAHIDDVKLSSKSQFAYLKERFFEEEQNI